jgi:hypothetical protein
MSSFQFQKNSYSWQVFGQGPGRTYSLYWERKDQSQTFRWTIPFHISAQKAIATIERYINLRYDLILTSSKKTKVVFCTSMQKLETDCCYWNINKAIIKILSLHSVHKYFLYCTCIYLQYASCQVQRKGKKVWGLGLGGGGGGRWEEGAKRHILGFRMEMKRITRDPTGYTVMFRTNRYFFLLHSALFLILSHFSLVVSVLFFLSLHVSLWLHLIFSHCLSFFRPPVLLFLITLPLVSPSYPSSFYDFSFSEAFCS